MTDRLIKILPSVGVMTNGADAAQIASSFGVPTTAKTIIRRVLQLPLPNEGSVHKVGIDEWAWMKGHRYGTILVDLEKRRVVQLLADRSVETSQAWLRKHPEIDLVSRDRGKIFREAATEGAPQAKRMVDRFHSTRRTLPKPWRSSFARRSGCSKRRRNAAQAKHVLLRGQQYLKRLRKSVVRVIANESACISGSGNGIGKAATKSRLPNSSASVRAGSTVPSNRKRLHRRSDDLALLPSLIPTFPRLSVRWNQGCHNVARLYEEIVTQGYTGTQRTLQMRLRPFRQKVARPVSKQTVIWDKPPSPRGVALMIVESQKVVPGLLL